jgi:glycosyltransferase involved in cell wall biosynthesis
VSRASRNNLVKILLVANYKPDRQKSMARYAELLSSGLSERGHEVEVIAPQPIATRFVSRESSLFRWLAYVDKFILFPPMLRLHSRQADLVHVCDHSNSSYLRWTGKTPNLITAHDMLAIRSALGHFPQNPTRPSGVKLQQWILSGLAHARNIVCVSEKTRQDLEALVPPGPKITVIPDPLNPDFIPAPPEDVTAIRKACGLAADEEYLLHVGKDNWYKNRPGVLRIFAELQKFPRFRQVKLIMAGASFPPALRETARGLSGVIECVEPSESQLRALYTGALALLFPSLEEGFGWPIVEAQACGCPVITSARSPMKEVAGDAAILIDPEDASSAAAIIAERIHETDALRRAGFANVRQYAIDNIIHRISDLYREILSSTPGKIRQSQSQT